MKKPIVLTLLLSVLIYIIFAVIPECFNLSPLPTGGWDWLSFIGMICAAIIALEGIIITLKKENEQMRKQHQLAVIPCLDIDGCSEFNQDNDNNIFRILRDKNSTLVNDGYRLPRKKGCKPEDIIAHANIKVKNIGLSTAFQINTYLYKLDSVEGLNSLEEISKERKRDIVDNFYDKINTSNYEYIEDDKLYNDEWQIYTAYNLTNDKRSEMNFVFDLKVNSKYYNIIEFRFNDIYENYYFQLFYFGFGNNEVEFFPISKVYEGISHKDKPCKKETNMIDEILEKYYKGSNIFKRLKKIDYAMLLIIIIVSITLVKIINGIFASLILGFALLVYLTARINHILFVEDGITKIKIYKLNWNKAEYRKKNNNEIIKYIRSSYGIKSKEEFQQLVTVLNDYAEDFKTPHYLKRAVLAGAFIPLYLKNIDIIYNSIGTDANFVFAVDIFLAIFILFMVYVINSILDSFMSKFFSIRNLIKAIKEELIHI